MTNKKEKIYDLEKLGREVAFMLKDGAPLSGVHFAYILNRKINKEDE